MKKITLAIIISIYSFNTFAQCNVLSEKVNDVNVYSNRVDIGNDIFLTPALATIGTKDSEMYSLWLDIYSGVSGYTTINTNVTTPKKMVIHFRDKTSITMNMTGSEVNPVSRTNGVMINRNSYYYDINEAALSQLISKPIKRIEFLDHHRGKKQKIKIYSHLFIEALGCLNRETQ